MVRQAQGERGKKYTIDFGRVLSNEYRGFCQEGNVDGSVFREAFDDSPGKLKGL